MAKATCTEDGCDERINARGLCNRHYLRRRSSGNLPPLQERPPNPHALTNVDTAAATADCATCGPSVPIRIRVRSSGRNGTRLTRECDKKQRRSKGETPRDRREERLRYKYGITLKEYESRWSAQSGKCALCGEEQEVLCVDHCHETGRVRGLLCSRCNTGIGHLRDDVTILRRAIDYLAV